MNIERILALADFIETVPDNQFNMNVCYRNNWGTEKQCGCLAGWGIEAIPTEHHVISEVYADFHLGTLYGDTIQRWLELSEDMNLFIADWAKIDNTPKGAANRLRALANGTYDEKLQELHDYLAIEQVI